MAAVAPDLERFLPLMVKIAALACSIGLAFQVSKMTWDFIEPGLVELPKPDSGQFPSTGSSESAVNGHIALADLHLLGVADAEPAETPQENAVAPETRLSFELKGILAGGEEGSSAIIAQRGGTEEYFKVGDMVFNTARLASIFAEHVLLDNRGNLEKLTFDEDAANLIQPGKNIPVSNSRPTKGSGNRFENRLKEISTAEEFVDLARSELLEDPQQALDNLGVEASDNGYRVTNKAGMLLGLGMQAGDVILSINGQSLGNIEQDRGLIDQVYADGQARIEVQRGSRRFIINHSFR